MRFSDFEREEMWALARFLKRLELIDIVNHADDKSEALLMQSAIFKMLHVLVDLGYDP